MKSEVAHLIDHTILKPEQLTPMSRGFVEEGARFGTYSVCVSPSTLLEVPEGLKVACVVGFPSGAVLNVKAYEAKQADGADETGIWSSILHRREGKFDQVEDEIRAVRADSRG